MTDIIRWMAPLFGCVALLAVAPTHAGQGSRTPLVVAQADTPRGGSSAPLSAPPSSVQPQPAPGSTPSVSPAPGGDKPVDKSAGDKPVDPLAKQAVGAVATLEGQATVTRQGGDTPLKVADYLLKGDVLQTGPDGQLGVTFDDGTTFNLGPNARMEVNSFAFQKGASTNAALFTVSRGTVGFTTNHIARSGDLKIATPTMTLGGPGATGLVEVPDSAATSGAQVSDAAVKLYSDSTGHTGHIDIYKPGSEQAKLAELSKPGTGYTIQSATSDVTAVAMKIPPEQAKKDKVVVRRVFTIQVAGARFITQRQVLLGLPLPGIPGVIVPGLVVPAAVPVAVPGILPGPAHSRRQPGIGLPGIRF